MRVGEFYLFLSIVFIQTFHWQVDATMQFWFFSLPSDWPVLPLQGLMRLRLGINANCSHITITLWIYHCILIGVQCVRCMSSSQLSVICNAVLVLQFRPYPVSCKYGDRLATNISVVHFLLFHSLFISGWLWLSSCWIFLVWQAQNHSWLTPTRTESLTTWWTRYLLKIDFTKLNTMSRGASVSSMELMLYTKLTPSSRSPLILTQGKVFVTNEQPQ